MFSLCITHFSPPMRARVFKFCIHHQRVKVYCEKVNHDAKIYFAFFSFFSISHSNVMHMKNRVKDFSETTAPRILNVGKKIEYDCLYLTFFFLSS